MYYCDKEQILKNIQKIHIGFDEKPFFRFVRLNLIDCFTYLKNGCDSKFSIEFPHLSKANLNTIISSLHLTKNVDSISIEYLKFDDYSYNPDTGESIIKVYFSAISYDFVANNPITLNELNDFKRERNVDKCCNQVGIATYRSSPKDYIRSIYCPNCGAPIPLNSNRIFKCSFCKNTAAISNDLIQWQLINLTIKAPII